VRNPFHSEPEAFRFLLLLIVGLVPIAVAATLGPTWLALVVLGVIAGGLAARAAQLRARKLRYPDLQVKMAPPHLGPTGERRVLIVANDTLGEEALLNEVRRLAAVPRTHVLLLVPALISSGGRLTGAIDYAGDRARARMKLALDRVGHDRAVAGTVSEEDPLVAIEDAFATFAPDEVVVATRRERTAGRLAPWLAGLARERFAVPVHHLVFEPGSAAQEPDEATSTRYRRDFGDEAARSFARRALAATGIVVALVMALAALINDTERQTASATPQLRLTQATALPSGASTAPATSTAPAKVIELKVVPEGRKGPEGKLHDDFTVTEFHVTVGQPLTLRIDNTDSVPHSITAPEAGVNIVASPGTHSYTLLVERPGRFEWHCVFPCDPWSMEHVGFMRGFIVATPS
jgi:heme/copper-type cytochrome/quinol oxidase subunit 2